MENKAVNICCDASSFLNHIQLKLRSKAGIAASGIYPFTPLPNPSIAFAVMHKCLQLRANTARLHQLQKESFQPLFFQNKQKQPPPRQFLLPFMSFILATDYVVQNSKPNYVSLPYTQTSSWEQASRPILRIFGRNKSNHL